MARMHPKGTATMVYSKWLLFALLILLGLPVIAQEPPSFPVFKAETIFTKHVSVEERLPILLNDTQQNRALHYFDPLSMTWQTYPLDVSEETPTVIIPRSDGSYRLHYLTHPTPNGDVNPDYNRLFIPGQGTTDAPTVCDLIQAVPDEGEWRFTVLDGESQYRLCHTETGQVTEPLPPEIAGTFELRFIEPGVLGCVEVYDTLGERTALSPDGRWILFETCHPTTPLQQNLYSYDLQTDEIRELGIFEDAVYLKVEGWLDDRRSIVKVVQNVTHGWSGIYVADVSQRASLVDVVTAQNGEIALFQNPFRTVTARGITSELDTNLHVGFEVVESNLETGESHVLVQYLFDEPRFFEGGRILRADDQIVVLQTEPGSFPDGPFYVFSSETGELLYQSEEINSLWIAADAMLIYEDGFDPPSLNLLKVEDNSIEQERLLTLSPSYTIPAQLAFSPDRTKFLYEDDGQHWLYDIEQRQKYPLTQELLNMAMQWLDNDTILAEVYAGEYCTYCGDNAFIARWLIRLERGNRRSKGTGIKNRCQC